MTVLLELLSALLEYLNVFYGIMQSADCLAVKALLSPQNSSIIPESYTYLLCSKLCWHNRHMPTVDSGLDSIGEVCHFFRTS